MSDQPSQQQTCPNCGFSLPPGARYCPECGTRVASAPYDPDAFRDAIEDAVPDTEQPPTVPAFKPVTVQPQETPPPTPESTAPVGEPLQAQPAWTASPAAWPSEPAYALPERRGWRENRTLWIILAIFGFIVFCCCGLGFLLFIVASFDSSFQSQVSLGTGLM
jgi:hypothetical protein